MARAGFARQALRRLGRPHILATAVIAGAAAAQHFRGREKLAPLRQAGDHSTFTAPYNVLVYVASRVPGSAFVDLERFPDLVALRDHWRNIRLEGLALRDAGAIRVATGANDLGFHTFFKRGWTRFYLYWYGHTPPSARALCPETVALLATLPSIKGALFAILPAGATLGRHRDPFAGSLRFHLGLDTPNSPSCWLKVDGERTWWRDGAGFVFDETYVHEAANETAADRLILLCDVERPLRWPINVVNGWVTRQVMSRTNTQNDEGDPVGAVNRLFERLQGVLQAGKRMKAKDRRRYYRLKRLLAIAAAILFGASVVT